MRIRFAARKRLIGMLLLPLALASAQASAWVNTRTQALPLARAIPLGTVPAASPMRIAVGLKLRNRAQLDAFIASLTTPGSPAFGQLMSDAGFAAAHLPTAAQAKAVADYLAAQGFTNIVVAPNRMMVSATGTAGIVQRAFHTSLMQYKLGARTVFANLTPPQVPDALGSTVLNVSGLHNLALFAGHANKLPPDPFNSLLGYGPQNFWSAYNANGTSWGSGVTIGIIMSGRTAPVMADLAVYRSHFGLPAIEPTAWYQTGSDGGDDAGLGEWDMDTQTSTGMAGQAGLRLYVAASLSTPDLAAAINQWVAENTAKVASASLGICEVLPWLTGDMDLVDQALAQAVASHGQTLFVSTGDAGSACSVAINAGLPLSGPPFQEYPSTSPYAVAVGGTTLLVDSAYNWSYEIAWNGTGGGPSYFEPAPAWQQGHVPGNAIGRGVPDIAMDADPNTAAIVYVDGAETFIGGTSLSSPLAAGVWARMLTQRGGALGFAAPYFYRAMPKLDAPGSASPKVKNTGLHDVIAGCNGFYCALPKWDYVTGVGTPHVDFLTPKLH